MVWLRSMEQNYGSSELGPLGFNLRAYLRSMQLNYGCSELASQHGDFVMG